MIFITLTSAVCGVNGWVDAEGFAKAKLHWFRRFVKLENGIPGHETLGRVFSNLDTGEFLVSSHQWVDQFAGSLRDEGVSIDGKVLRGSFDRAAGKSPLHPVIALATEAKLVLRQMSVDDKRDEIPSVPQLLNLFDFAGSVVTLDAMHCQERPLNASLPRMRTIRVRIISDCRTDPAG